MPEAEKVEKPLLEEGALTAGVEVPAAPPSEELRDEGSEAAETAREDRGARLWVSLGSEEGLDAAAVQTTLAELAGVDADKVKHVDVRSAHSFVYVERDSLDAFLAAHGKERGEKTMRIERARRRRRR